ncbi:phosphoribosylglycinamide formyltransferase [Halosquirtibacter xylanolyticus]|uniref:phosphoribosylglycinamide formyltransferase n=1 Tax=Halosquirtibacter xylanolyticus TaxID=3374599 RepID=UPI00374976EB|nr:phosphoribosylglycinamide formyltransferase [Prolixibacteraceae bacterium]
MKQISIFASGTGSNAKNIIEYFRNDPNTNINLIICNNENAGVLDIASQEDIPVILIKRSELESPSNLITILKNRKIDLIVLAGFLLKIPSVLTTTFPIINIHPALLPKYGGKGMYGKHVHQAVLENRDKVSGITIHHVNEVYDKGEILLQKEVEIENLETAQSLQEKIHKLEHHYYPLVIKEILEQM